MSDDPSVSPPPDKPKPHRHGGPVWQSKHSKKGTIARPGTSKRGPRWIRIRQRQQQVLELRTHGLAYEAIAKRVGVTKSQVERDITTAMELMIKEPAERAFHIEMRRLDELFAAHVDAARAGDVNATYACLRVVELRARLMGWDKADATARLRISTGGSTPKEMEISFVLPGGQKLSLDGPGVPPRTPAEMSQPLPPSPNRIRPLETDIVYDKIQPPSFRVGRGGFNWE